MAARRCSSVPVVMICQTAFMTRPSSGLRLAKSATVGAVGTVVVAGLAPARASR